MSEDRKDYYNEFGKEDQNDGADNTSTTSNVDNSNIECANTNQQNDLKKEQVSYSFWAEQVAASESSFTEGEYVTEKSTDSERGQGDFYSQSQAYGAESGDGSMSGIGFQVVDGRADESVRKPRFATRLLKGMCAALFFGVIAAGTFIGVNNLYYHLNPEQSPIHFQFGSNSKDGSGGLKLVNAGYGGQIQATTTTDGNISQPTNIKTVIKDAMPSIVTITSTFEQDYNWFGQRGSEEYDGGGSGIIIGKSDTELLIATNNHVIEGAKNILIQFIDDTEGHATVKGTDPSMDLAVVAVPLSEISKVTLQEIEIANIGNSDDVEVGEMVVAIGNALGYGQSTTVGYISAKDREVSVEDKLMILLQTDASINPGNSGGALINMDGEVVGINTLKYVAEKVEGMGFAIPISTAMPILQDLMNREVIADDDKGYLGVYIDNVTEEVSAFFNWPVGVLVVSPIEGGAAEKAGIVNGDIIVGVNGTKISNTVQLQEKVNSYRHGTSIQVTVMRSVNGEYVEKEFTVTLEKRSVDVK